MCIRDSYQVNRSGAEKLYNLAAEMAGLSGNETVLDLYCGVGTIGLSVANKVKKVIGVEIVPDAVEDAKRKDVYKRQVMMSMDYDVKVSEVHGMSQRGGSVVTYVRAGEKVASPIIEKGEADLILAFEKLEAARWLPYLKPNGKLIINTQEIDPMPVITGAAKYPENIIDGIKTAGANVITVDALPLAVEAGTAKAVSYTHLNLAPRYLQL